MPVVEYTPERFDALRQFVAKIGLRLGLSHRPFVDYYYTNQDWCRLYLFLSNEENILATFGQDRMRFEYQRRETTIGFGGGFYSLQPGTGGILFIQWHHSCAVGLVYGGSEDTHKMIHARKWAYYGGVKVHTLNRAYDVYPTDSWLKMSAKSVARVISRSLLSRFASRVPAEVRKQVSVREEGEFTNDLLPKESPFTFRFAPAIDYLNWRYNLGLSFVHYRLFRILSGRQTAGYAVINESQERLVVSHCDGTDARTLAHGVLLCVLQVGQDDRKPRSAILASCHPAMQEIYRRFGFRPERQDRPFAIGSLRGPVDIAPDTSNWLINLDWGDNVLRSPFLDERVNGVRQSQGN